MQKYKMDCGCELELLDETINPDTGYPALNIDFYNLRLDCDKTWEVFVDSTKGVFQLETQLGETWSKKLKPSSIDELAALTAILRPGVLKAQLDGKSLTQHFIDRKHHLEPANPIDETIEDVLENTHQILVYQEQTLQIAQKIADFDLKQADVLRRAIGKKIPELMTKVEDEFIEGIKKIGIVSEEKGKEIWDMIRKSERYSFNASHSYSYALLGIWSAFLKSHFPLLFYSSWLSFAKYRLDSKEEIKQLVRDAKYHGIKINGPTILKLSPDFIISNKEIYFGISNIKGIGESQYKKLFEAVETAKKTLNKSIDNFTWLEILLTICTKISKTIVTNLILVGAFDHFGYNRKRMIHEYNILSQLTDKELGQILPNMSLIDSFSMIKASKPRQKTIRGLIENLARPSSSLDDNIIWINKTEEDLLGISITVSKLDTCDALEGNTSCKELQDGKLGELIVQGEILNIKEIKTKKSAEAMAFITLEDDTGYADNIVCFPNVWRDFKNILYKGNTVVLEGFASKNKNSFVINTVKQI